MGIGELLAKSDSIEEIGELLKGIDDFNGETPLMWAACFGYDKIVKVLLQYSKIDPNLQNNDGDTALIWAAYRIHDKVVAALLQHPQTNPNLQNEYGYTPLMLAANQGYYGIVSVIKNNLKSIATIRQTARLSYQNRYGTARVGFFAGLPDEINKKIAALTGDPSAHTEDQASKIAAAGYRSVTQP